MTERSQREFCLQLARDAPRDSAEARLFREAAHHYGQAQFGDPAFAAAERMKAVRRYKKARALRNQRLGHDQET